MVVTLTGVTFTRSYLNKFGVTFIRSYLNTAKVTFIRSYPNRSYPSESYLYKKLSWHELSKIGLISQSIFFGGQLVDQMGA